jgi:outer membrane protein assembly factor BamE (lipoprotein component of BamABCDE complex)
MNLTEQIEQAIQEVTNARQSDNVMMTLDEYADEVYYYVSTTRYTETGMNDSKVNRFKGKEKLIGMIKKAIKEDKDAQEFIK